MGAPGVCQIVRSGHPHTNSRLSTESGMTNHPGPERNHLLAALPESLKDEFFARLKPVDLKLGAVVYESDQPFASVYFPTNCIISLLHVTRSGSSAEISVIGNDGLVGVTALLGSNSTPNRAIVQSGGYAYQMPIPALLHYFNTSDEFRALTLRYTLGLMTQMSQTAVCNRHHSIDQQLCRWLLLALDRIEGNQLEMTQGLIANMLGVRREGVTEAAGKLQKLGIIRYKRGHIQVMDRKRLEEMSCECYAEVKRETVRLERQRTQT